MNNEPSPGNAYLADHVCLLVDSFARLVGRHLIATAASPESTAKAIFAADFVVLSSGLETDPLFNYANRCALDLFELDWAALTALPARKSAEPVHQDTRAKLMQRAIEDGFIDNYSGVGISATGRRFMIEQAVVWNVTDRSGGLHGQAATFKRWSDI
jgi:hypothetical protein